MTLAPYVAILGRGPGRSRSLTRDEAQEAMALMLGAAAAPQAVGALLMLLRMKGETADEIAGLSHAARLALSRMPTADLDWPTYAAGRSRGEPWFLLSAKLVAQAGKRVILHGWNGKTDAVRGRLAELDIPIGRTASEISDALDAKNIVYAPIEDLHPQLFDLLNLRDTFGLRSCINTVCRMLNPAAADTSVQGVFHPSYRLLQSDAAAILGWKNLSVIKGGGGEFERHPSKSLSVFGLTNGARYDTTLPPLSETAVRLLDGPEAATTPSGLWSGAQRDDFAESVVLGTAEIAFSAMGEADPMTQARALWDQRLHQFEGHL